MILKAHKTHDGRKVLAVCDSDIIGKRFEENGMQLDLSSSFYKGEECSEDVLAKQLSTPCSVNIAGEKSVNFFLERGLIGKENIIRIGGVPHAQCLLRIE